MPHYLIRRLHQQERATGMPCLSSWLLLTLLAQADPLTSQPITRRRLAAIVAIFRELPLHLTQPSEYFLQHLSQVAVFRSFARQFSLKAGALRSFCGQFPLQLCNLFLCRHALSVAALATLPV